MISLGTSELQLEQKSKAGPNWLTIEKKTIIKLQLVSRPYMVQFSNEGKKS